MTLRAIAQINSIPSGSTIVQPNIVGVTDGSAAAAGSVGEYVSSNIPVGSAVPATTGVLVNVAAISLTAGDWDVMGVIFTNPDADTVQTSSIGSISQTSVTLSTPWQTTQPITNVGGSLTLNMPSRRVLTTSTASVFLVAQCTFTTGNQNLYGFISARRRR